MRRLTGQGWKVAVERKAGNVMIAAALDVLSQPADGHSLFPANARIASPADADAQFAVQPERDFVPVDQDRGQL